MLSELTLDKLILKEASDSPMGQPLGGGPLGGTYVGHGYSPELNQLGADLANQSKLSACSAGDCRVRVFAGAGGTSSFKLKTPSVRELP